MDHLTIVAAYFNQPQIYEEWWRVLMSYPDDLATKVKLRLVDDCSQDHPLAVPKEIQDRFDVMAFRSLKDQPWNEMGCRNLAMKHADGWCYMTDPDYILMPEHAQRLFGFMSLATADAKWCGPLERGRFYHLLSMNHSDGRSLHRPENIAVVHSKDFWKSGGYDENFAGGYGFSDALLWRAMKLVAHCRDVFVQDVSMHHYTKGIIEKPDGTRITDAASPASRDTSRNQVIFNRTNAKIAAKGWTRYLRERGPVVRFEWERIA